MAQQQSPSNKVQRWALFTKQNPWTVDILELINFLEFYCYFQQHVDLNKRERFNVVRCPLAGRAELLRTEIGLPKMVLIGLCLLPVSSSYLVQESSLRLLEVPIFFDKMF